MSLTILPVGDSKTVGSPFNTAEGGYQAPLLSILTAAPGYSVTIPDAHTAIRNTPPYSTTAASLEDFPAFAAAWTAADPDHILVNLGTNDLPLIRDGSLVEGAWAMGDLLDAMHAEWPSARVWLARPIRTDYTTEQDLLDDTWIPNVLASRSAWAAVGPDERDFLPGYLTDTTHPTGVGYDRTAAQWREVIVSFY